MNHKIIISGLVLAAMLGACAAPLEAYEPQSMDEALRFGDQAFYYRDFGKAAKFYSEAIELGPGQALPVVKMALLDYADNRYEKALAQFERAAALKKDFRTDDFLKAAAEKMKANRDLLASIERLNRGDDNSTGLLEAHARAFERLSSGKIYMWLLWPHLDFLYRKDPANERILTLLAGGFFGSSDPRWAAYYYKKLAALRPHDIALARRLADCLVNTGSYDEAGLYYRKALREAVRTGSGEDRKELLRLIRALPKSTQAVAGLIESEDYETAFKQLKRCTALNPSDPWALTMMGTIYEEIGQGWQSERLYQKVIKQFPEYPGGHYSLGRFYLLKKKKYVEAIEELERFRESLAECLPWIEAESRRKEQAKNLVQATRDIAYIYGEVMKEPQKALAVLEPFSAAHPKEAEIHYDLGCTYLALKKRISAYQEFKKVIELDPKSELAKEAENAIDYIQKRPDYGRYTGPYD